MKASSTVVVLVLLAGCKDPPATPTSVVERIEAGASLSEDDLRVFRSMSPGMTEACVAKVRDKGIDAMPKQTEDCFEMMPPQRWTGLWRNQFEGSTFCPAPARECSHDTPGDGIWLDFAEPLPQNKMMGLGGLYAIDFIGRRTRHAGQFGHFGLWKHEIIVDRIISIRELEPPPPAEKRH